MKNYLLIDSDGHANGVIKTSNFNISHYPGNTYVEVDNTISHIVAQNTENIKITTPTDLLIAESLLKQKS